MLKSPASFKLPRRIATFNKLQCELNSVTPVTATVRVGWLVEVEPSMTRQADPLVWPDWVGR